MPRHALQVRDIERLENADPIRPAQAYTTATTFCCPTEPGSICDEITVVC